MAKTPQKKRLPKRMKAPRKAAAARTAKRLSKSTASRAGSAKRTPSKKGSQRRAVSSNDSPRKAVSAKSAAPTATRTYTPIKARPFPPRPIPARPTLSPAKVNVLTGPSRDFKPYEPKRGEAYMSSAQLEHFRQILLAWRRELMEEVDRTVHHMKDDAANFPDPNDRATQESEFGLELRTRDRERKLLKKIDSALGRIDEGTYGYCEETGDEIGLRRLEARPVATLCVEAQERRELAERQFRDREDYNR
jgi:DnaK suppressor protein